MPVEIAPWEWDQILALAPDDASRKAGEALGTPGRWHSTGFGTAAEAGPASVWGLCQGSGTTPYQTCVELAEPAYKCSCPSRKFPCKHSLGLLLLWSLGGITPEEPPAWVRAWLTERAARATRAPRVDAPGAAAPTEAAAQAGRKTTGRREERVSTGVEELRRWLTDQVRGGLAGVVGAPWQHFDAMGARLVDAQAGGLAAMVRRLALVGGDPDRLLAELGLIWLLARAWERLDELPEPLRATVRTRVGFTTPTEEVLATPAVRDDWGVIGVRDEVDDNNLTTRRVWLRGARTGRPALVLAFAVGGRPLPAEFIPGTSIDAQLCFYPGSTPLRALVSQRHGDPVGLTSVGGPTGVGAALREHAQALAGDPWLDRWPMVLAGVTPVGPPWRVVDGDGEALSLDLADPWPLVAAAGRASVVVAGEFNPERGLRPLLAWTAEGMVRP